MRKEYDFSKGTRGKHSSKHLQILGDQGSKEDLETAMKIQEIIEKDLKEREDFKVIWRELDESERDNIRASWQKKITVILDGFNN